MAAPGDHTAQPAVMHHENGRSAHHLEENVHVLHGRLFGYTNSVVGRDREMKIWMKVRQSINQSHIVGKSVNHITTLYHIKTLILASLT